MAASVGTHLAALASGPFLFVALAPTGIPLPVEVLSLPLAADQFRDARAWPERAEPGPDRGGVAGLGRAAEVGLPVAQRRRGLAEPGVQHAPVT